MNKKMIARLLCGFVMTLSAGFCGSGLLCAQEYDFSWSRAAVTGGRTGVKYADADNVAGAMGRVSGCRYIAPSGKVFRCGATRKVAKIMIGAQSSMAEVKSVIGWSPRAMRAHAPESDLSDWLVDALMSFCEKKTGEKVDVGFLNFGGIRVDMPEGNILQDDIMSMFPFKNNVCRLELYGRDIRAILEQMASERWQVVGGVRCVSRRDGTLLSADVGGEPLDDDRIYGVMTISFLLGGGDGYSIARNALKVEVLDEYVMDVMLPYVKSLTAEGKPVEYKADGRVKIVD